MKIKKICFGTRLCDLYGRDGYQPHIKEGEDYWYFFEEDTDIFRETKEHWNKLRVSYVRSGCLFYCFPDHPDVKEQFCPVNCFMASQFIVAELDPVKDLTEIASFGGDILSDKDFAKKIYCFDDERTVVKNWPNERETEVDEEEILDGAEYLLLKTLETE